MKQIITALDIGSYSMKLVVGEMYKEELNVLVSCIERSKGIKNGLVINPEEALKSLTSLFKRASEELGSKIDKVVMSVPSEEIEFIAVDGYTTITGESKIIHGEDIVRALQACVYNKVPSNKELITVMPVEYIIDNEKIVEDPKGLVGSRLSLSAILALSPRKNVYPLLSLLESIGVSVADINFNSLADYTELKKPIYDETLGCVINIGAYKTEISIINKGVLTASSVLNVGGRNIDRDIAYVYNLSRKDAVRLKEKFALGSKKNASTSSSEDELTKDNETVKINQYELSEIVYNRLREILEVSKKEINRLTNKEISYIITTGGTTEIEDFSYTYEEVFPGKYPIVKEDTIGCRSREYTTVLGLIKYYYNKLKFRNAVASTVDEEKEKELFTVKKKINNNLLGKIYGYFFDN
ncbi:MAG: cell division protein FtsA [Bacilli bacterium]